MVALFQQRRESFHVSEDAPMVDLREHMIMAPPARPCVTPQACAQRRSRIPSHTHLSPCLRPTLQIEGNPDAVFMHTLAGRSCQLDAARRAARSIRDPAYSLHRCTAAAFPARRAATTPPFPPTHAPTPSIPFTHHNLPPSLASASTPT